MRTKLAEWFNELGNKGKQAEFHYRMATLIFPKWSVPWYNRGLRAKYQSQWRESLEFNRRAAELNPGDQAAWWNMGIAATALRDWEQARRGWKGCGIEMDGRSGEFRFPPVTACVRLDPQDTGEVVWGDRIDPARIVINSIPLPESHRAFGDIVLHDGAANGSREFKGVQVPVFDELALWEPSLYNTYRTEVIVHEKATLERLSDLCRERELGFEDWSTVQFICAQCSRGDRKEHECKWEDPTGAPRKVAIAAWTAEEAVEVLRAWVAVEEGVKYSAPEQVFTAAGRKP